MAHYGLFWLVHGAFVILLITGHFAIRFRGSWPTRSSTPCTSLGLALAALALLLSHGASLLLNYVGRGEYLRAAPGGQMFAPYPRVFVLHITILLGGVLVTSLGQPEFLSFSWSCSRRSRTSASISPSEQRNRRRATVKSRR